MLYLNTTAKISQKRMRKISINYKIYIKMRKKCEKYEKGYTISSMVDNNGGMVNKTRF